MQITIDTKHDKPEDIFKAIKLVQDILDKQGIGLSFDNHKSDIDTHADEPVDEPVDEQSIIDLANDDSSPFAQPTASAADTKPEDVPADAPSTTFVDMFAPEQPKEETPQKTSAVEHLSDDVNSSAKIDSSSGIDPALLQKTLSQNSLSKSQSSLSKEKQVKSAEEDDDWGPRTKLTIADLERY